MAIFLSFQLISKTCCKKVARYFHTFVTFSEYMIELNIQCDKFASILDIVGENCVNWVDLRHEQRIEYTCYTLIWLSICSFIFQQ